MKVACRITWRHFHRVLGKDYFFAGVIHAGPPDVYMSESRAVLDKLIGPDREESYGKLKMVFMRIERLWIFRVNVFED